MNVQTNNQKGFTIIEVVLVLAIAGLIFLMVFIALPALQRSQRDTQRREDVSRFVSQLTSYATNNRGAIPGNQGDLTDFNTSYMKSGGEEFNDPTGAPYDPKFYSSMPGNPSGAEIQYVKGRNCDNQSGGSRQAAVRVMLEGGGVFCQNVQ